MFIFIFVSIALTRSIYHGISGFLVVTQLRPRPILVLEQDQPIASEGPVTAHIRLVDARNGMQPVDIVVPGRPDADHSGYTATTVAGTGFVTCTVAMAAKSSPREEDRVARTGGVSHPTRTKHQQRRLPPNESDHTCSENRMGITAFQELNVLVPGIQKPVEI